jgi:hypothetical protein
VELNRERLEREVAALVPRDVKRADPESRRRLRLASASALLGLPALKTGAAALNERRFALAYALDCLVDWQLGGTGERRSVTKL